ncbi:protein kinase [Actinomadura sp. NAK00032]|uniref:WD40 repeat domain-containing serine/threonine protein kinase n=1 Tax=Actinomadura sp. NAK00032 TaxID=2742128 RepID=UPI00159143B5|nr:serine/threonine-protein kinase [Actinomadura sp. NAK00032]QKW37827.1 protein kinase [Actinomadura sp. NAK00032]
MEALRDGDPRQIGPYRVEGRLGAGGMGEVFLGVSPGGRRVAVKVIRAEHSARPEFRVRFAREVDAARKVGGFYTAQVVDADPDAPEPWMATAYIPGASLRDVAPLPPGEVARLGAALAEGLAAIHASGLVHRDLKPGNVIMSPDGPRIIDFGIARDVGAGTLTADGAVLGTYAYMAPEQVRGEPSGPPADVFALGCVLAFAATGRSPFDAATIPAIVHRVLHEPPLLDGLAGPLRPLVASCLAKEPADRPSTDRILAHLADPDAAPLAVSTSPSDPDADRTEERGTTPFTRVADAVLPAAGIPRRTVLAGAVAATAAAVGVPAFLLTRGGERPQAAASADTLRPPTMTLAKDGQPVADVAFSPNGKILACGTPGETVLLWDPVAGHVIHELRTSAGTAAVAFSPDGRFLATGHTNATVRLWDVESADTRPPRPLRTLRAKDVQVNALAFSPDTRTLAGPSRLWDTATGRVLGDLSGAEGVAAMVFSPDGRRVMAGMDGFQGRAEPGSVRVWDARTRTLVAHIADQATKTSSLALTPDGRTLVTAGGGAAIRLWDAARIRITGVLNSDRAGDVTEVAVSADGAVLAAAGADLTIRLWDLATRRVTATLAATGPVRGLALSPDGRTVAGGSERRGQTAVNLWSLR